MADLDPGPYNKSMFPIRMNIVLRIIMASGQVTGLPVRVTWPVHRALAWLSAEFSRRATAPPMPLATRSDPDVCVAVEGVEAALAALVDEGFLVQSGAGYTARWVINAEWATSARRELLREDPLTAALLVQAGQRLAVWASTALKNSETAAASWAPAVDGPTPTVRQPPLVVLRY
jgi:hypothetical protein